MDVEDDDCPALDDDAVAGVLAALLLECDMNHSKCAQGRFRVEALHEVQRLSLVVRPNCFVSDSMEVEALGRSRLRSVLPRLEKETESSTSLSFDKTDDARDGERGRPEDVNNPLSVDTAALVGLASEVQERTVGLGLLLFKRLLVLLLLSV